MRCPKCNTELPEGSLFCTECGTKLETKKKNNLLVIGIVAALFVVGGGVAVYNGFDSKDTGQSTLAVKGNTDSAESSTLTANIGAEEPSITDKDQTENNIDTRRDEVITTDSKATSEQVSVEESTTIEKSQLNASKNTSGNIHLPYGDYSGSTNAGKPNGQGRLTFTSSHLIDSRDPKGRIAEIGDYVIGEWNNGNLVQGRWFGSDGNVKGSIIIGM